MKTADVLIGGATIGTLEARQNSLLGFRYCDDYRHNHDATPLSVSMPLSAAHHSDSAVTPYFWGLLPDDQQVIRRWSQEYQISPSNLFGLLCNIGDDLPGGIRIVSPDRAETAGEEPVEWIGVEGVEERLATLRNDPAAWAGRPAAGRWSLPGAQAKIALLHDNGQWGVPTGNIPTNRILKPAIPGLAEHDLNEHLCLSAMRQLGLQAAASEVITFGSERAIVVTRYDRYQDRYGAWRRVHQEDLCQALGLHPSAKYESDGGPGASDIVKLLRAVMASRLAERAVSDFLRALVFNWVIVGTDAHAKNYSLLLSGRDVRLAPFYDVGSALPYSTFIPKEKLAMKIGHDYRMSHVHGRAWRQLAERCGVDEDRMRAIIDSVLGFIANAFAEVGQSDSVRSLDSSLPDRLTALIAENVEHCRVSLRSWDTPTTVDGSGRYD